MKKSEDRLKVIENIKAATERGDLNCKVEIGDPTNIDMETVLNFDVMRQQPINKIKKIIATKIANEYTKIFNRDTEIVGLENVKGIRTGAIITCNHFSPQDSTVIRYFTNKIHKKHKLDIIIEESNIFMTGQFGFLMNNCGTIPISQSKQYISQSFMPAMEYYLKKRHFILIYPEEEMWFNYRKPRSFKIGAYHIAVKNDVPIISCFIEMKEIPGEYDENGFNKLKYILHILPTIYPDQDKDYQEAKKEMMNKDFEQKKECYERVYNKKLTYDFSEEDIAGLKEDE